MCLPDEQCLEVNVKKHLKSRHKKEEKEDKYSKEESLLKAQYYTMQVEKWKNTYDREKKFRLKAELMTPGLRKDIRHQIR